MEDVFHSRVAPILWSTTARRRCRPDCRPATGRYRDRRRERGLNGTNRIEEFGFVEGTNSYGKWASAGTVGEPEDPYQQYLEDEGLARLHYEDFSDRQAFVDTHPTPLPEEAYNDNWIGRRGLELLENAPEDQSWHLEVSFAGPHDPAARHLGSGSVAADLRRAVQTPDRVRSGNPGGV